MSKKYLSLSKEQALEYSEFISERRSGALFVPIRLVRKAREYTNDFVSPDSDIRSQIISECNEYRLV